MMLPQTSFQRGLALVVTAIVAVSTIAFVHAQGRDRDSTWTAPPEQAARVNPLVSREGAEAGGAKLFHQRCASCHGDDARGTSRAPDLTDEHVQAQSDGALFWKITSGNAHAGMPAFSFLPELQRWQLVLHVRATGATSR